jgi:hypothetical protein
MRRLHGNLQDIDGKDETKTMLTIKGIVRVPMVSALWTLLLFACLGCYPLAAQEAQQRTFNSPGEAAQAMITAISAHDKDTLMQIFGPDSKSLISSGDPVADRTTGDLILRGYQQMNRIVLDSDNSATLYLGDVNWPFPIPIVKHDGLWHFDTAAGMKEVIYRRIGRNEFSAIQIGHALVDAQREYFSQVRTGASVRQYAQKFISDEGEQNGLYWKPSAGEPESPVGPLVAFAVMGKYALNASGPTPFHGYIFKLLQEQGPAAPGGAKSYMVNGNMTGGFAFLAYPVQYRNSGVMTFIVGKNGIVYQKDLGENTAALAAAIDEYNPDKSWKKAE